MVDNRNLERGIKKVLTSKHLSSGKDANLLNYLIEATQSGKPLKEIVIAMEVYGRDATFNPSEDSLVRSSIYGLRKKLDVYYLDEGKSDSIKISIPKGSYAVKIEEIKKKKRQTRVVMITIMTSTISLLFICVGIITYMYSELNSNSGNFRPPLLIVMYGLNLSNPKIQ